MRPTTLAPVHPPALGSLQALRAELNARVERLPPFWTAFALTLTETVGAAALAMPIAFAAVGPLVGAALLVGFGVLNMITVTLFAEASARSGSIRHGNAFLGRLVHDFLGGPASVVARLCMFALCCTLLAAYYTGFASTLSAATGVPAPFWVTVICVAGLSLILRRTLCGTLVSALFVGTVNIGILVALSVIALGHATTENLLHSSLAPAAGAPFEASHLKLAFGVAAVAYFGHLSVSNCARTVLRRDPSGRSLKRGTAAAVGVAIILYCLWAVSVGAAVGSDRLQGEGGTALVALAERAGPGVHVLGVVFAVLGLGMSSVHFGLGIVNLARELVSDATRSESSGRTGIDPATVVAVLPILGVFGYVQWTYLDGTPSFTTPLALLGALAMPLLAGVLPVLLLLASRARGLPADGARAWRATSGPVVLGLILLLSFGGILAHALVIWDDPLARAAAFAVAAITAGVIGDLVRRRAFSPRLCVDIQQRANGVGAEVVIAFGGEAIRPIPRPRYVEHLRKPLAPKAVVPGLPDLEIELPRGVGTHVQIHAFRTLAGSGTEPFTGTIAFRQGLFGRTVVELDGSSGSTRAILSTARVATGNASYPVDILLLPDGVRERCREAWARIDVSTPAGSAMPPGTWAHLDIELDANPRIDVSTPAGATMPLGTRAHLDIELGAGRRSGRSALTASAAGPEPMPLTS